MSSNSKLTEKEVIKLANDLYRDEVETSFIYEELARRVKDERVAAKFRELAAMERGHAKFWEAFLKRRGVKPEFKGPGFRLRLKTSLLKLLGFGLTLKLLELGEDEAIRAYSELLNYPGLSQDERRALKKILEDELVHEEEFEEEESKLKDFLMHVRDAVLGMNDGLVEILSVSAGLAGAYGNPTPVALGGAIVGISGALSMAVGTYVSVKAQKEVKEGTLARIKLAAKYAAETLAKRVRDYMIRKGHSRETAETIAKETTDNPELLSSILAEEEYGIKEEALENPKVAGMYTGLFYVLGAFIPLTPYFLGLHVTYALIASFIIAGLMLATSGSLIAISSGLPAGRKALELVLSGLGSATITYLIGLAASVFLGINAG